MAAVEGGPGDYSDAGCVAVFIHFAFFFAVLSRISTEEQEFGKLFGSLSLLQLAATKLAFVSQSSDPISIVMNFWRFRTPSLPGVYRYRS